MQTCPACHSKLHYGELEGRRVLICIEHGEQATLEARQPLKQDVERAWTRDHQPKEFKNEECFLQAVKALANAFGWTKFYHTRKSQRSDPGWPDCVIARPGRVIYAELKMPGKYPTKDQMEWMELLKWGGNEVYLWFPVDWKEIIEVLS